MGGFKQAATKGNDPDSILALQKNRDGEDMDAQIEPRFKDDHLVATVDESGQDTQDCLRAP